MTAAGLAATLGWKPWAEAADRLARDDDELPLGLRVLLGSVDDTGTGAERERGASDRAL